jgi:hypothetical protein
VVATGCRHPGWVEDLVASTTPRGLPVWGARSAPGSVKAKQMRVLKETLGKHVRFGGEELRGWLPTGSAVPLPAPVENAIVDVRILETEGGFILEWKSRNGNDSNDSWHRTVADAENQAEDQFGIRASDWQAPNGGV